MLYDCLGWHVSTMLCGDLGRQTGVVFPIFKKGDWRVCSDYWGHHTPPPPQKALCQGAGKESLFVIRTSDSRGTMQVSPWLQNTGPAHYPLINIQVCGRLPIQFTCVLLTWKSHSAIGQLVVKRTERKSKAVDLLVDLHLYPHLWS